MREVSPAIRPHARTMSTRTNLPDDVTRQPFRVGRALRQGVSRGRLRNAALDRPLWGVRSVEPIRGRLEFLRAASTRLRPWQSFGGSSAAALLGIPVHPELQRTNATVVVVAAQHHTVPRSAGFTGVRILPDNLRTMEIDGIRVTDPVTTWFLLARELGLHHLIAAGDVAITDSTRTERRCGATSIDAFVEAMPRWTRSPGAAMARSAIERMRVGVDSPMESQLRSIIVDAGYPEPEVHPPVSVPDGRILHPDVGYPELRLGVEYEGIGHADPARMRRDIRRIEDFAAAGWDTLRVTSDDMFPEPHSLLARLRVKYLRRGGKLDW